LQCIKQSAVNPQCCAGCGESHGISVLSFKNCVQAMKNEFGPLQMNCCCADCS